jgi:hypothetical protein
MNFRSFTEPEFRPGGACSPCGNVSIFTPPPPDYCHNTALAENNLASTTALLQKGAYAFGPAYRHQSTLSTQVNYTSEDLPIALTATQSDSTPGMVSASYLIHARLSLLCPAPAHPLPLCHQAVHLVNSGAEVLNWY